jgi:ribosomal protein S18 acetylase RimI-like enzyme
MPGAGSDQILELERAAFEAWRAEEIVALGPWRLRCMRGVTNRANSVWAGPGEPAEGLAAAIARAEAFYGARGLPTIFQIAPIADARLDGLLAERGYELRELVSFQVTEAEHIARIAPRALLSARCDAALSEEWFELSGRRGRYRGDAVPVYRAFLERVAPRAGFASARSAGAREPAAVGLTIVAPPFAGVFSMLTLPEQRKHGLGEAVLGEIGRFAVARGADRVYLQVDVSAAPARALYARAGFSETHRYHYRWRAGP